MTSQVQDRDRARIGREVRAKIGQRLRTMYAAWIKQELPENLRGLIRRRSVPQQRQ